MDFKELIYGLRSLTLKHQARKREQRMLGKPP